jgi:xanthine dehydrogenase accessory factor
LNNYAHRRITVQDYSELGKLIGSSPDNYVVVMTFGYRTDDVAVRALLEKDFGYFGLLGSKKKIIQLFDVYRSEGIAEENINRIFAPVGLSINSRTPEEIAVSIAAQIIQVKNR